MTLLHSVDELTTTIRTAADARRRQLPGHTSGNRLIVGIVGPPGAGKSTIAEAVVARLNDERDGVAEDAAATATATTGETTTALLPMDGFHLPQARLVELGRRERMGAPDTFDVEGFLATLTALRSSSSDTTVLAPGFDRTIEEAVPDAIAIGPECSIVVVEGNYLLFTEHGWGAVRSLLDVSVFVRLERGIRLTRLIDRHVRFGKSRQAAEDWALGPDEANARLINATAERADHIIEL